MHFRCQRTNCTAFVIDIGRSICYSIETKDDELVPEANSTFYQQICIKGIDIINLRLQNVKQALTKGIRCHLTCTVPSDCKRQRLWQVERNAGAVFIDSGAFHLPQLITRNECYEICIKTGKKVNIMIFKCYKPIYYISHVLS